MNENLENNEMRLMCAQSQKKILDTPHCETDRLNRQIRTDMSIISHLTNN